MRNNTTVKRRTWLNKSEEENKNAPSVELAGIMAGTKLLAIGMALIDSDSGSLATVTAVPA